ncbi:MAG: N-acetyl-gamma-glutamyl-phosphate reductase [Firmicutes bacterium]|nr:N-acetyl-gamma-glutamyl-phosphate reductase [Bacillota bacterium]
MKPKVFIDGKEGTTGLQIYDRLSQRDDIELLLIPEEQRKDLALRSEYINAADLVFLCLPDGAAQMAVSMVQNPNTRIIDTSTIHRVMSSWVYGFPELLGLRDAIVTARRVANPGCHATGFLSVVAPLVDLETLPADYPLTCYSLTGYSGGGKSLIAEYTDPNRNPLLAAPNIYATGLEHKHLPEMKEMANLDFPPAFSPILGDFYKGMATTVLLNNRLLPGRVTAENLWEQISIYYEGSPVISVQPFGGTEPRISAEALAGSDRLEIIVSGHRHQTQLTALFDNLGKGASGAAVQNMNLMLGFEETRGLHL